MAAQRNRLSEFSSQNTWSLNKLGTLKAAFATSNGSRTPSRSKAVLVNPRRFSCEKNQL